MDTESSALIKPRVIALRITVLSLLIGLVLFMGIAIFMVQQGFVPSIGTNIICYLAAGMLFLAIVAQTILANFMDKQGRESLNPQQIRPWLEQFQARTIMGCALLEGPAIMGVIGYMIEHDLIGLIVGGVAAVLMFALHFPTEQKMINYVNQQRELAGMSAG